MSAPTPLDGPLPTIISGTYLKRQIGVGNPFTGTYLAVSGGAGTVFDNLVTPPTGGVNAEEASLDIAQAVGSSLNTWTQNTVTLRSYPTAYGTQTNGHTFNTPKIIANMIKKNFDWVMNFYLENSIARDGSGVPIP